MPGRRVNPYVLLALLFAAAFAAVLTTGEPGRSRLPSVAESLPDTVGTWQGIDRYYCQSPSCRRSFTAGQLGGETRCGVCGHELDTVTLAEKKILPENTVILKKEYVRPGRRAVFVTLVISGEQRAGIHRPQWCLPAQGYRIASSSRLDVPLSGERTMFVSLLSLDRPAGGTGDTGRRERAFAYAYWYVGNDRKTPYHLERLFWSAFDSIFRGVNQRWAWVAVATSGSPESDATRETLRRFIGGLDGVITPAAGPADG